MSCKLHWHSKLEYNKNEQLPSVFFKNFFKQIQNQQKASIQVCSCLQNLVILAIFMNIREIGYLTDSKKVVISSIP